MDTEERSWGVPAAASFLCSECGLWRALTERIRVRAANMCARCVDRARK